MTTGTMRFHFAGILLLCGVSGFAQFRLGVKGGAAVSSVLISSQVQVDKASASHTDVQKAVNSYFGALVFQVKAGKKFVIRPGVAYFKKAWEIDGKDLGRISSSRVLRKYDINYIQVPVNILLTTPLANGRIYLGAGPYAAYAFAGTVAVNGEKYDLEFKKFDEPVFTYLSGDSYRPIRFISHYTINRIDYGLNGMMGYEFNIGLFLEAGIDIGVRQVSTSQERYDVQWSRTVRDPRSSVKYSIFQIGFGWMINNRGYHLK